MTVPYGLVAGISTSTTRFTELDLYRCILDYGGAEYFDPSHAFPFKYTLVLLACQRFGDAVVYLWTCNRSTAAIHLLVLFLHYGLLLPHLPLSPPLLNLRSSTMHSDLSPCSILRLWVQQFVTAAFPDIAVDYLAMLNVQWLPHVRGLLPRDGEEIIHIKCQQAIGGVLETFLLSLDEASLRKVVGSVLQADSSSLSLERLRSGGRLDAYFPAESVDLLLARTAFVKMSRDADAAGAVHFYSLAGRFIDAIEVLTTQLAQAFVVERGTEEAIICARDFHRTFLVSNQGPVVDQLHRFGRSELIRNLEYLLNLAAFFEQCSAKQYTAALSALDSLGVAPRDESEVNACKLKVMGMESSLLQSLDRLFLSAMQCFRAIHSSLKAGLRELPGVLSDKEHNMKEMRQRAKALVLLASLLRQKLRHASETTAQLSRLEIEMSML